MNVLFNKPNLLFLIFVRNQNRALLLSKLRRPIYRTKLIKALTTIVIRKNGDRAWWLNGMRHREDGPAEICADGSQMWWLNDKRHRDDGPAAILSNGTYVWAKNGKWHRDDGPAIIFPDGLKMWYNDDRVL